MNHALGPSLGVVPVVLGLALVVGTVAYLIYRRERQYRHAERLKALEYGRRLPNDPPDPDRALAHRSFSTGLWGAFWGFVFAANSDIVGDGLAIPLALAVASAVIGVTGIVCGTVLSFRVRCAPNGSMLAAQPSAAKPVSDPDAYDVVSARG